MEGTATADADEHGAEEANGVENETATVDTAGSDPEVPLDVIFEVLRNRRRRQVLQFLREQSADAVSLSDVAEYVAALENEKPVAELTSQERKRVYVGLYQCHLPKMDGMGVVTYDQNRGIIEETETTDRLDPYLDLSTGEIPKDVLSIYYTAIGAFGVLSALAVSAGVSPSWFSPTLVLGAFGLAILCCVGYDRIGSANPR